MPDSRRPADPRSTELADEQAALRRVATLVARGDSPEEIFSAVSSEVGRFFSAEAAIARFEPDGSAMIVVGLTPGIPVVSIGTRWELEEYLASTAVYRTGRPARNDHTGHSGASGPVADGLRQMNFVSTVAAPITVDGSLWGVMTVSDERKRLPANAEERVAKFTELVGMAIANAESRATLRQLVEEQAALRRVAELVARGTGPAAVFEAVSTEVAGLFGAEAGVARFEPDGSGMVLVGLSEGMREIPLGTRWPLEDFLACTEVHRTCRAARSERTGWGDASGPAAEALRKMNPVSMVAAPIVVDGELWGAITVADTRKSLPASAEQRVEKFTELVATAIADTESRAELATSEARARDLAREQAALRRVATMVAQESPPAKVFAQVAESVARLFGFEVAQVFSYDREGHAIIVGGWGDVAFRRHGVYRAGSRFDLDGDSLAGRVYRTALPARIDDYRRTSGSIGAGARKAGLRAAVGSPIVVHGRLWGALTVGTTRTDPLPEDAEARLAKFTDLVATAISNVEARAEVERLAYEQSALRRVATLVARAPASEHLFSTVAQEVASVLDVPGVIVTRYDDDGMALTLGEAFRPDLAGAERFVGVGARMPRDPGSLAAQVFDTHGPARVDDFSMLPGTVGDLARAARLGSGCAAPILVNGAVWGKMCVFSRAGTVLPAGTENRVNDFIELVATAIANYEARAELAASEARARELADEQAALRRVATLVARGVRPEDIFSAVTNEMGRLFGSPQAYVGRFEADGSAMIVVGVSDGIRGVSIGSRWELEDHMASTWVYRTGRPVRLERSDFEHASGEMAELLREIGAVATVGAPIAVEGNLWGFVTVACMERLPADAEERLQKFTELLATAIANAESRAELAASRARIIAATDGARRRIERDLHDGAQQRLVTLAVALRRAEAKVTGSDELRADLARVAEGLTTAVDELRELSRGIHPSILSEGGLAPALKALGRRSSLRVKLDMGFEQRLPDHVEVAAYYSVSEALTNASKHANATRVWVSLRLDDGMLLLSIRDDGVGGADASRGSGLTGLRDRIDALGGKLQLESPCGRGTLIEVQIPIAGPAERNGEPDAALAHATATDAPG
jgi:signal transduction histidine kinase/CBS domain-containing protein